MTGEVSTLKRPSADLLARFRVEQIGDESIRTYLERGYSLAICCRHCPRLNEWTPQELEARFGTKLDLPIADLAARLTCEGAGGRTTSLFFRTSMMSGGAGHQKSRPEDSCAEVLRASPSYVCVSGCRYCRSADGRSEVVVRQAAVDSPVSQAMPLEAPVTTQRGWLSVIGLRLPGSSRVSTRPS